MCFKSRCSDSEALPWRVWQVPSWKPCHRSGAEDAQGRQERSAGEQGSGASALCSAEDAAAVWKHPSTVISGLQGTQVYLLPEITRKRFQP